ncbi:hypothetical protein [Streptomyces sp. NBC_01465]|uniref:hypothetical protein n=1 Tax=Streptomyces sp. NBC_01465 TaxID=2903878 RepID=UPI002E32677A|nr:hypothetical protein [Streptomyces sp. NBC_01465]
MQYLAGPFLLSVLKRGRAIEQLLGPSESPDRIGVSYVEVRPAEGNYEIYLHAVLDTEPQTYDLVSLPPLFDAEEEDFGLLVATTSDPAAALDAAADRTGAVRERWVNQSMAGDGYRDYVLAGRPGQAPDGRPWPTPQSS